MHGPGRSGGPDPDPPATSPPVGPERPLLLRRLRIGGLIALPLLTAIAAVGAWSGIPPAPGLLLPCAVAIGLCLLAAAAPAIPGVRTQAVPLAVLWVLALGLTGAACLMPGGAVNSVPIFMASLGLLASVYLPWGPAPQGIVAGGLFGLAVGAVLAAPAPGPAPLTLDTASGAAVFGGLALLLGHSPLVARTVRERLVQAAGMEDAGRRLSESLQHRLEQANRLLERRGLALESALEDAEKANVSKSRFLAGISHELRTPLTSILGFAAMLRNGAAGPVTAKQFDYASEICTSAEHLLRLLEGILAHTRIEANEDPLQLSDVPIDLLVEVACRQVAPAALEAKLDIRRSVPTGAHLVGDRQKLLQVMLNLLSNAIKFTPAGGEIGTTILDLGDEIEVTVWDHGLGLGPDDLERIFRPFEQVPEANRTSRKGFGLGLAISRRLVERHGGSIRAESRDDRGTRFVVRLPKSGPPPTLPATHALAS